MANVLKALTQRFQRHQLNDSPNQVKPAPASETVDTVEGTPSSSDSEDEEQSKPESKVKLAEKRKHLKTTSGSSSSDEELRELNKKTRFNGHLSHQHYFLPPSSYPRKKVKILTYNKTSIGRPCIDFNKMQSSRMVKRPIPRVKPGNQHHSFCDVQYTPVMQLDLAKPLMIERFKPVVQT